MVEVSILGSGTSVPHPARRPPAFLLREGALALMIDCGAGSSTGLAAAGVTLDQLTGVLLTHFHPDHTAELVPLLFALRNPVGPRRTADLPIWGPDGVAQLLGALEQLHGDWLRPKGFAVRPRVVRPGRALSIGPARVRAFAVEHSGPSLAYRVELGGKVICFSGDSGVCDALVAAASDADLFVCECGALEHEAVTGHLTPTDVGRVAAAARCRRVVLTHLYERVVASDPLSRVRAGFDGPVMLAADGMRFSSGG